MVITPDWKMAAAGLLLWAGGAGAAAPHAKAAGGRPVQTLARTPIAPPVDRLFRGTIALDVDASDVAHRVFVVRERVPVQRAR